MTPKPVPHMPLGIPGAVRLAQPVSASAGALRWIAMQVLNAPTSFGHTDCERIVDAALAQPVLAVTSLAYVAAGVAVLSWAIRVRAPLAGAAGVALVAVGAGASPTTGPSRHGRSSPTTGPSSRWQRCTSPAWPGADAGSGGRPWQNRRGSSRWDWPPTPRDAPGRRCAGPTACGNTTAPGTSSLPLPPDGPPWP